MTPNPRAQNGAPDVISNQGTGPTTSPEQPIGRTSDIQGNTPPEKKSDKPFDMYAQVKLVRQAINKKLNRNLEEWGHTTLARLLDYQSDKGESMDTYITFFRDLLLFLAKPKISQEFKESVPYGLVRVQALSDFFIDLLGHTDYDQFVAYHRMYDNYKEDDSATFLSYAEDYLTGDDLRRVLAAHGQETEEVDQPAAQYNDGAHLVALLDRYFPGVEWKDDKLVIATHEKMKWFLEHKEEQRIKEEQKTPADKKADEVRRQIENRIDGFYDIDPFKAFRLKIPPQSAVSPEKSASKKATVQSAGKSSAKKSTSKKKA